MLLGTLDGFLLDGGLDGKLICTALSTGDDISGGDALGTPLNDAEGTTVGNDVGKFEGMDDGFVLGFKIGTTFCVLGGIDDGMLVVTELGIQI